MVGRALRAALFAAGLMVLWTVARPAHAASAPFCDDRGATALAAPPTLEAPDDAIRRTLFSSCDHDQVEFGLAVRTQHGRATPPSDDSERGWRLPAVLPVPAPGALLLRAHVHSAPCVGVRARVERPPRA